MKLQGLLFFIHIFLQCTMNTDATTPTAYTYSPPPSVTLSPDQRLQLVWSHVLTPSEIRWCYWQQKPKVNSTWTKVVGYDVTNKQTLNISAQSWLYKFLDSQSPCKGGLWSSEDAQDLVGFHQMNVVANNGTQYKSPVVEVNLINDTCPFIKQELCSCSYMGCIAGIAVVFIILVAVVIVVILYFNRILPNGCLKMLNISPYEQVPQEDEEESGASKASSVEFLQDEVEKLKNEKLQLEETLRATEDEMKAVENERDKLRTDVSAKIGLCNQADKDLDLFTEKLKNVTLGPSDDLKLAVKVIEGTEIQWFRYGNPLKHEPKKVEISKGKLIIKKGVPDISGIYSCKAMTGQLVQQTEATVRIIKGDQEAPLFSDYIHGNLRAKYGERFELSVTLTGTPTPNIEWWGANKRLDTMDRITAVTQTAQSGIVCKLTFDPFKKEDAGVVQVSAQNKLGRTSCSAELLVMDNDTAPKLIKGLVHKTVRPGDSVTFEVIVRGDPTPSIKWANSTVPLNTVEDSKHIQIKDTQLMDGDIKSILIISNCSKNDGGMISVTVENAHGNTFCDAFLTVEEK